MTSDLARQWLQTIVQIFAFAGAISVAVWQQYKIDSRVMDDRKRRHIACRATLPFSLARISQYAENCASLLATTYPVNGDAAYWASAPNLPELPGNVIADLKACIETGEAHVIAPIAELVRFCQVQNSRMVGQFTRVRGDIWIEQHTYNQTFYDIARLFALSERFYEYGRLETETVSVKIEQEDIERAARILTIANFNDFSKYIGMRDISADPV